MKGFTSFFSQKRYFTLSKKLIALGLLAVIVACKPSVLVKTIKDLPYRSPVLGESSRPHLLDLYLSRIPGFKPFPLLVYIHSGGWLMNNKKDCPGYFFAQRGFAVACINYRYSHEALFPAQIQDVQEAVRWLKAHAEEYSFDRDRIGVFGASAGGHLSALLGSAGNDRRLLGKTAYPHLSPQVQAVADWYGPTDFSQVPPAFAGSPTPATLASYNDKPWFVYTEAVTRLVGGAIATHQKVATLANPIPYIDAHDPPFLIVHGDADRVVPLSQSELLAKALQAKGVEVDFRAVPGLTHSYRLKNGRDNPQIFEPTLEFFNHHLK
jgi:acetyl esterase/lipase